MVTRMKGLARGDQVLLGAGGETFLSLGESGSSLGAEEGGALVAGADAPP